MKKFPQQHQGDDTVRRLPRQRQKSAWITGAAMVIGAGISYAGSQSAAGKNEASQKAALAQNRSQFDTQQLNNWNQYLLQRGTNPSGNTTVGGFGSGQPVNTKLPLWAQVSSGGTPSGGRRLVRIGSPAPTPTLVAASPA